MVEYIPGPGEFEISKLFRYAAKYDDLTLTPALCAPAFSSPVLLIVQFVNVEVESTKYKRSPTASLSSNSAFSIQAPVALTSTVEVAKPAVLASLPPVPEILNPSITAD
ncbi:MAG: Uncharacterised protein [Methanobacteriota archaeon]|nr:MAG: Uncharacterised protein [Euryarchaeota archaeon]